MDVCIRAGNGSDPATNKEGASQDATLRLHLKSIPKECYKFPPKL